MVFPCVVNRNIRDRRNGNAQEALNIVEACLRCAKKYVNFIFSCVLFSSCVIGYRAVDEIDLSAGGAANVLSKLGQTINAMRQQAWQSSS